MLMYLFNLTGLHSNQFHANSEAPKAFWTFVLIIAVPQLKRNAISIKWKIKPNRQTHTLKTKFGFKMASEFCESEIKWTDQRIELPAKWVVKGRVGVVQGLCKISNCSCQLQRKVHRKFCPPAGPFCEAPANWIWNEESIFGEIVKFYSDEIKCPAAKYAEEEEMLAQKRTNNKQTFLQWQLNKLSENWDRNGPGLLTNTNMFNGTLKKV